MFCLRFKDLVEKHPLSDIQTADEKAAQAVPPEGEEAPGIEPAKTEAEMKAEYLASREALFKVSKEEKNKLKRFEEAITRPYFHVKALDESQISNWHKYLDFIEEELELPKVRPHTTSDNLESLSDGNCSFEKLVSPFLLTSMVVQAVQKSCLLFVVAAFCINPCSC